MHCTVCYFFFSLLDCMCKLDFLRQWSKKVQCMKRRMHRVMFLINCFLCRFSHIAFCTSCFAHWAKLCAKSLVTLSDLNLAPCSTRLQCRFRHCMAVSFSGDAVAGLFLNSGKKLRQDSRLVFQLLSKTPGSSCLELPGARSPPRSQTLRGARES